MEVDVYRLKRIFERNSPSILIQSLYRGYKSRNFITFYYKKRTANAITIQKNVRGWLRRKAFEKDLKELLAKTGDEDLLLTTEEIRKRDNAKYLFKHMYAYWKMKKRERTRWAAALKL